MGWKSHKIHKKNKMNLLKKYFKSKFYSDDILIIKFYNLLTFLYALGRTLTINLGGQLFVAELIALLNFPFIKFKTLFKDVANFKYISYCFLFLLLAQISSDIINRSSPIDFIRGWALIVLSFISILFLLNQFITKPNSILYFLLGAFLASLLFGEGELNLNIQEENTNYFKERFAGFLNMAILICSYFLMKVNKRYHVVFLFLVYFLINFFMDARSNGLIVLLASVLLFLKFKRVLITRKSIIIILIISLPLAYVGYSLYVNQVLNHDFGGANSKNQLSKASNPYNPFELIFYGRTDFFVLAQAVSEKPIVGYGSWGKDPGGKFSALYRFLSEYDFEDVSYIRAHSIILGFWAYAGIAGFLAVILLYFRLIKLFFRYYNYNSISVLLPVLIVSFGQTVWALFFSAIQDLRIAFPFFTALLLTELHNQNTKRIDNENTLI